MILSQIITYNNQQRGIKFPLSIASMSFYSETHNCSWRHKLLWDLKFKDMYDNRFNCIIDIKALCGILEEMTSPLGHQERGRWLTIPTEGHSAIEGGLNGTTLLGLSAPQTLTKGGGNAGKEFPVKMSKISIKSYCIVILKTYQESGFLGLILIFREQL